MVERLAALLRQKKAVLTLFGDVAAEIARMVPADWIRIDLEDQGKLWSRSVKPGSEPQRPGLGEVPRRKSQDSEYATEIVGGFVACLLLGIGEASGRLLLRRKSGAFTPEEIKVLRPVADVLSIGLRARPFDPPPKPRSPFDEGGEPGALI